jgi:polysaccharide deacetylase family protein (PEP-CTERM system associated)
MRHAFTVDVEDWYEGIPIAPEARRIAERRLDVGLDRLLGVMSERGQRGTFFVLGTVAEQHPRSIARIVDAGHEVGCHGWSHDLLYTMTPDRFREETERARAIVADITNSPVTAYRAAYFSVTRESWWALEILADLGFRYDSSVFPVRNWRYGVPGFGHGPQRVATEHGVIVEVPLSVRRLLGRDLPVAGGAYFRLYPYHVTRWNVRSLEEEARPLVFYVHPWELDPDHPRVPFHWKPRLTHYVNLRSTERRLRRLLADFDFGPVEEVFADELS